MADQPSYQMMDKSWTLIQVTDWQLIMTLWLLDLFPSLAVYKLVWWFSAIPWFIHVTLCLCYRMPFALLTHYRPMPVLWSRSDGSGATLSSSSRPWEASWSEPVSQWVSPVMHNADHFKNHRVSLLSDRRLIWRVCLCVVFQRWRN